MRFGHEPRVAVLSRIGTLDAAPVPQPVAWTIAAALVLAIGSSAAGDLLFLVALPLTLLALLCAAAAMWRIDDRRAVDWFAPACAGLSALAVMPLGSSIKNAAPWYSALYFASPIVAVVAVGAFAAGDAIVRRRAVRIAVASSIILHFLAPIGVPRPPIDIWSLTQTAVTALLHGIHPYTVRASDLSRGGFDYGYAIGIYVYMPATLLVFAPAVALLGDFRFVLAACVPATIALLQATGRRLAADQRLVDALTLVYVLHPRALHMTANGWNEPLLVVAAAAFAYFVVRAPDGAGQATAFFLLPALKQYVVAPVAIYLAMRPPRPRWRAVLIGVGVAAATVLPFAIWDWRATLDGVLYQVRTQRAPRLDADSLVAAVTVATGFAPSRLLSVTMQGVVGAIAYVKLRHRGAAGVLLASALSLLATFLAGWQASMNYYYFIGSLLVVAAMLMAAEPDGVAPTPEAHAGGAGRTRVAHGIVRSIAIATATMTIAAAAKVVHITAMCEPHRTWTRVRAGATAVVRDGGYSKARPGDALFVCETPHASGPIVWHRDLDCYCAPAGTDPAVLGALLDGACTVDNLQPSVTDATGACRYARCETHVDP